MKVQAKKAILSFETKDGKSHTITRNDTVTINEDYKNVGFFRLKEQRNPEGDSKHVYDGLSAIKHIYKDLFKPDEIIETDNSVVLSNRVNIDSITIREESAEVEATVQHTNRAAYYDCY